MELRMDSGKVEHLEFEMAVEWVDVKVVWRAGEKVSCWVVSRVASLELKLVVKMESSTVEMMADVMVYELVA
jgi:hypothetical protein